MHTYSLLAYYVQLPLRTDGCAAMPRPDGGGDEMGGPPRGQRRGAFYFINGKEKKGGEKKRSDAMMRGAAALGSSVEMLLLRLAVTSAWITASLSIYIVLFLLLRHGNCCNLCARNRGQGLLDHLMDNDEDDSEDEEEEDDESDEDIERGERRRTFEEEAYASSGAVVGVIV